MGKSPHSPLVIVLLVLIVPFISGCPRESTRNDADDVQLQFTLTPDPPSVGPVSAIIMLTDKEGKPVHGADLKLEGNMNHAGMKPVFADAQEKEPGHYEATLELTMGGDWFVLINGTLADGRKLSRKADVPGVKSR